MKSKHIWADTIIWLAAAVAMFPVIFIAANSFMGGGEIVSRYSPEMLPTNAGDFTSHNIHFVRFGLIPWEPTLEQYRRLLLESPAYLRMFWNSVLIVAPVLLGQCVLAPLAAYGLENIRWKYKEAIFFTYIVVMLMPTQLSLVPNFIVAGWLNIRDSYLHTSRAVPSAGRVSGAPAAEELSKGVHGSRRPGRRRTVSDV